MSKYDDDVFGDECYDGGYNEHDLMKDNAVNKLKTKGIGKTKLKIKDNKNNLTENNKEVETPIVKLTKEEIVAAKMLEKKRKREEAIAKSKAEVALREKEALILREKEAAELQKKEVDALNDEEDWDTKYL